ncbi:BrnT family toxin [Rhizobium wenxiniae]|uniref:BrnT family toxin n=1 Tax=Rhizobium wenxiniae TaxID=1737357 RepID=UPI001C6ED0D5|nr:BrnT family toxin [Rhizobium wenxiniae]MBW9086888.1 BrnT family toxin [Rhizobium wenxiniae]
MADGEFDPEKDASNREKHGLSLSFGDEIFGDRAHLVISSIREADGEERFKVIGAVGDRLFIGVFVWRNDVRRFISVRRSNKSEERLYRSSR